MEKPEEAQEPTTTNFTKLHMSRRMYIASALVLIAILAVTGTLIKLLTRAGTSDCTGVQLAPGANIQASIDSNPAYTTFCLASGVYRNQSLRPKTGNVFMGNGQDRTILNGSNEITNFGKLGSLWYASNQTQELGASGECDDNYPACTEPALLYYDDQALVATTSRSNVTAGKFFFDHAANRVYFANDPTNHKIEIGALEIAFDGRRPGLGPKNKGGAVDVTIKNLTVEKYAQHAQKGAIETNDSWLVQKVTSQLNSGQGITLLGDHPHITYSKFLRNGQIGIGANGGDGVDNNYGHAYYGVTVDNTEIAYNNASHYNYGWEAGGTKFWATKGSQINLNWVHHNIGPGLWDDGFNDDIVYDGNLIEDNEQNGIFHEIGGKARITSNKIQRNGGINGSLGAGNAIQNSQGGISISSGKDVTIAFNYIYNNGRGIVLIDDPHYPDPTNKIRIAANVIRDSGDQAIAASIPSYNKTGGSLKDFEIDYNQYTPNEAFGFNGAARSWSEWRAYGKDKNGGQKGGSYPTLYKVGIRPETDAVPITSILVPLSKAAVKGTVLVRARAEDITGISKVAFYVDNKLVATDKSYPYSFNWNTTGLSNGTHNLSTKAYDGENHSTTSSQLSVTVKN